MQVSACVSQNRRRSTGSVVPSSPSIGWPLSKPPAGLGRQATTSILGSLAASRRLIASLPVLTPKRTRSRSPDKNQSSPAACWARTRTIPVNNASRQRSIACCVREGSVMVSRSVKSTSVRLVGGAPAAWRAYMVPQDGCPAGAPRPARRPWRGPSVGARGSASVGCAPSPGPCLGSPARPCLRVLGWTRGARRGEGRGHAGDMVSARWELGPGAALLRGAAGVSHPRDLRPGAAVGDSVRGSDPVCLGSHDRVPCGLSPSLEAPPHFRDTEAYTASGRMLSVDAAVLGRVRLAAPVGNAPAPPAARDRVP